MFAYCVCVSVSPPVRACGRVCTRVCLLEMKDNYWSDIAVFMLLLAPLLTVSGISDKHSYYSIIYRVITDANNRRDVL